MNVLLGLLYLVWHLFWIMFSVVYVAWQVQFLACRVESTTVGIKWYHFWNQNIERCFTSLLLVFWVPLLWPSLLFFENLGNKAVWVSTRNPSWHHCCDLKFQFIVSLWGEIITLILGANILIWHLWWWHCLHFVRCLLHPFLMQNMISETSVTQLWYWPVHKHKAQTKA